MFITNKYKSLYDKIIEKARKENRTYDSSVHEYHHVIPRCLGGTEIVPLTHKEHYVCHHLLPKFTEGKIKSQMMIAFFTFFVFDNENVSFSKRPKMPPKMYEKYKQEFSKACSVLSSRPIDSYIYSFKNKISGEIFEGTIFAFKKHSGLNSQEVYNLKSEIGKNRTFHSKQWGIYDENIQMYTCDIPHIGTKLPEKTCSKCGYSASPGNFNRWHGVKIPCVS